MLTKYTLILILILLLITIFITNFFNIINTTNDYNVKYSLINNNNTRQHDDNVIIDDKFKNLFWFLHLSDTHLSYFRDQERKTLLIEFCEQLLPIISPSVLLLTGDITDARTKYPLGSEQYLDEWIMYRDVRDRCLRANSKLKWLDIKGNHDTFNTYKEYNNFNNFIVQTNMSNDGRSYRYEFIANDGNHYSFIGADACLKPGVRRPFNFVGQFDNDELNKLIKFKEQSKNSTYTIWYGHYPTASIANRQQFRQIINGPYLCGHYHTIHGLVPNMITTQQQGYLECETGDWKDYRIFRIVVIDHSLFTFANYYYRPHQQQPLIVITNPRSILHQMEHLEPFWRTSNSSHIRVLIFSHNKIFNAKAFIHREQKFNENNVLEMFELKNVQDNNETPLWVSRWSPQKYSKHLYYITVIASDDHYSNQITVPFSLDGSRVEFSFLARLILRFDFSTITLFVYSWGFFMSTLPFIFLRIFTTNNNDYILYMLNLSRRRYIRKIIFRLYLLTHQNRIFYPILFIPFYSAIGPWFLAYLVSDYIGIVFAWGQFIDGTFLPVGFTFLFAAIFMLIIHLPFIIILSIIVYLRYIEISNLKNNKNHEQPDTSSRITNNNNKMNRLNEINRQIFRKINFYVLVCFILIVSQFFISFVYYSAYGFLAFITNFYVWSCLIYFYLIRMAIKLNVNDFKKSTSIINNRKTYHHKSSIENIGDGTIDDNDDDDNY